MRASILMTIVLAIGLIGSYSEPSASSDSDANDAIFKDYNFPGHPHLTHLCQQRVSGAGREITWDAFASPAAPREVVDYYRRKLGDAGFTREGEGGAWRLPAGAPHPHRVLDVLASGTDNPSRACENQPPSNTRTIILLSRSN